MALTVFNRIPSKLALFSLVSCVALTSGCASQKAMVAETEAASATSGTQIVKPSGFEKLFGLISPYRISIQQGNFVSQEMVSQLKEGMTREQVRFLLGTALLTDMFHEDRWDYPFRMLKPNGEVISSRLAIYFKDNTVAKFEGGNLPTEKEYLAHITNSAIASRLESMPTETQKKK
ncbi:outer membrane protein assembly factor BamE [Undibacterium fentianense]|uniref:Outer membrane protein assembly factor BamE n=1 Tax=Undibacterium fentianense TaxID=2828728 RepID=A0A941IDF6_9BURK|nr:outer membrane protein assembly factor BamE [Undibacterium fentianense]MBR7799923.1 outer membrane protein assembly factor BamE [Undibacterium fentianense]